jgi:hypothetical protein
MFKHSVSRAVPARSLSGGSRRLIASAVLLVAAGVTSMQVRAEDNPNAAPLLENQAVAGQLADVGTTGLGLAMGAAEANPLGILTLGAKAVVYSQIKEAPAVEQPKLWSAYGAFGWGATANNLCVLAAIATGGAAAALCPLIGLMTGVTVYNGDEEKRNRETALAVCAEERKVNPELVCEAPAPKS